MKQRIYKTGVLMLLLALLFQQSMAQQESVSPKKLDSAQQKNYQQQMKDLQQNMRELQSQMRSLQQKHITETLKKNAESLKKLRLQTFDSTQNFVWVDSLRSLSRSLSNNIHANIGSLNDFNFNNLNITGLDSKKRFQQEKLIEKTKTFSKSYPADKNDKLTISNQYGKVTVNTWNKKEFKIDVEIIVGTENEGDTKKLLDAVDIASSQDQSGVSFKTNITEQNRSNGFFGSSRNNVRRKIIINYTVFMPVKNALSITNSYGSVVLPDLEGPVIVSNNYGSFTAKELNNEANELRLNYTGASIGTLNGGTLKFNYGNLKIGTANNLKAVIGFSPVNIDRLKSGANIKMQYGSGLKINSIDKDLKNLDIDANYTKVFLGLNGSENFIFDITATYGRFSHNDDFVKVQAQPESNGSQRYNSTKNYKGYVGKASSDNKITIRSNYSGVNFN
ncbi:MAG: hypothetical protein ACRYFA_03420 [Janthinobacterium lividum]